MRAVDVVPSRGCFRKVFGVALATVALSVVVTVAVEVPMGLPLVLAKVLRGSR